MCVAPRASSVIASAVEDVRLVEREVRVLGERRAAERVAVQVVGRDHLVRVDEPSGERRADEAGAARDEDSLALESHAASLASRYRFLRWRDRAHRRRARARRAGRRRRRRAARDLLGARARERGTPHPLDAPLRSGRRHAASRGRRLREARRMRSPSRRSRGPGLHRDLRRPAGGDRGGHATRAGGSGSGSAAPTAARSRASTGFASSSPPSPQGGP